MESGNGVHFPNCANEEADVQWCGSTSEALALSGELEFILTPHITSEIAYAVAMHELGHIKEPRPIQRSNRAQTRGVGLGAAQRAEVDFTHGRLCGGLVAAVR